MTVAFLSVGAIIIGNLLVGIHDVNRFLADHDSITEASLSAFKRVASRNMIAAVASIPLGVAFIGLGIYMVIAGGWEGRVLVPFASISLVSIGLAGRASDKRSQALPCEPDLNGEYQRVCMIWKKSIWPSF